VNGSDDDDDDSGTDDREPIACRQCMRVRVALDGATAGERGEDDDDDDDDVESEAAAATADEELTTGDTAAAAAAGKAAVLPDSRSGASDARAAGARDGVRRTSNASI
jgi:hypothetical protein